jgi:predicted amidohydrolase YtcJ
MAGPKTQRIDLKGKTAIPGIVDLHQHPFTEGMMQVWDQKWIPEIPHRRYGEEWDSADEVIKAVKLAVAKAKPGDFVLIPRTWVKQGIAGSGGLGRNVCQQITLEQLDAVSPDTPVFFIGIVNLSAFAVNSKAASLIKPLMPKDAQVFFQPGRPCLATGGDIDGVLPPSVQAVNDYIYWATPLEQQMDNYRAATKAISARGITLAKEHTALPLTTGIRELWARGELTVRLRMPFPLTPVVSGVTVQVPPEDAETLFRRVGNMSGVGDDMLRFVGIRPPAVGGNMAGGDVWTFDKKVRPYPDRWGNPSPYGGRVGEGGAEAFRGREALVQTVRYGWDVSADHTVGDRAVAEVVKAFEEGLKTQIVKRPNQHLTINHTPLARPEEIHRMKDLGIFASIGSWHILSDSMLEAALTHQGTERVNNMLPMKSYINLGMKPALEGDTFDYPTFWRMEKAITKKDDMYKRVWNPKERVTRQEALWICTNWPPYHIGEEKKVGTVEAGKYADFVVIDRDYMTVPEDSIHEIKILMTVMGGKIVHEVAGAVR